jgi:Lipocalin-like domain
MMCATERTPRAKEKTMESNPLIGTWRLLSWENRSVEEDAQISYPLGEDATAYIMYNQDGEQPRGWCKAHLSSGS